MGKTNSSNIVECIGRAVNELTVAWYCREKLAYNTAVNRSYLAYYHAMQALILDKNPNCRKFTSVATAFEKSYVQTGKLSDNYYMAITELYNLCDSADYDFAFTVNKNEVDECFEASKKMLMTAISILQETVDFSELDLDNVPWVAASSKAKSISKMELQ